MKSYEIYIANECQYVARDSDGLLNNSTGDWVGRIYGATSQLEAIQLYQNYREAWLDANAEYSQALQALKNGAGSDTANYQWQLHASERKMAEFAGLMHNLKGVEE